MLRSSRNGAGSFCRSVVLLERALAIGVMCTVAARYGDFRWNAVVGINDHRLGTPPLTRSGLHEWGLERE